MPTNSVGPNGLTTQTIQDILSEILNGTPDYAGLYQIYGSDINVDPNSPDGQLINIFAQAKLDMLQYIAGVYNSFDPDRAIGRQLDARCAINGVVRQPGTYSSQRVQVTVDRAVSLTGVNSNPTNPFTVADGNGNQYVLVDDYVFFGPDSQELVFRAALLGPVSSLPNTITNIVTILLGVVSVNNGSGPDELGQLEESDYSLRVRRQKSVALPNKGYLEGLEAGLINISGVTQARVYENNTNTTDSNGIPAHSIWVIVEGGANADIANAIYVKRNAGCGMKGSVLVNVDQVDGTVFPIRFDRPTPQNLWISFNVAAIGSGSVDPAYIRTQLLAQLSYNINQPADTTTIVSLIRQISPAASVSAEGVSDDGISYVSLLSPNAINKQWALASTRIIINGSPGP